jgi:hypothetical protein
MSTILFKDLIEENKTKLMSLMQWNNYTMNDVTIPLVDELKEHALMVLSKSYGMFHVEPDIIKPLEADIFIYFPVLMQQLAISRLMDAYGVLPEDTIMDTMTRTESVTTQTEENSELTLGTSNTDTNEVNTETTTTGTVLIENDSSNTQNSTTNIENTSGVDSTGNRSVNLSHSMPEQAITGGTGNFPVDLEGTPILSSAYVQGATSNFSTSNPINTTETSEQTIANTSIGENDSLTTNDVTVSNTGTTTRTSVNSGSDVAESTTTTDSVNDVQESRTRTETNKQYAYEIRAFLESTDTLIAFSRWEDKFSWVVGII